MTSYNKLLTLPLFQGLSQQDLWVMAESIPFAFLQHQAGDVMMREDSPCHQLTFLLNGMMDVTAHADDHGYTLTEPLRAPQIIEPEHLFGLNQHFVRTYTAKTPCSTMSTSKTHVVQLTNRLIVFRLNLLNIISTQSQRMQRQPWHPQPTDLHQRIIHFFKDRSLRPAGEKVLKIKVVRLATGLNASRLDISIALNAMQADGLVELTRRHITAPTLERLT